MPAVVLGLDVYSGGAVTYADLKAAWDAGFRILWVKCSMGWGDDINVQQTVIWARQIGFYIGIYHWADGTNTVTAQVTRFAKWIDLLHPNIIAIDHEQWWSNWDLYFQWANHQIDFKQVPWLPTSIIDSVGKGICAGIKTRYPNAYIQLYTAAWFSSCDPGMANWIRLYSGWYADYTEWTGESKVFADFKALAASARTMAGVKVNWMPEGSVKCDIHQIGSAKIGYRSWDVNVFQGTEDDFKALIHAIPTPPVPIPTYTTYKVIVDILRVRSVTPSIYSNIYKRIYLNNPLYITETVTRSEAGAVRLWGKLRHDVATDPDLWTCLKQDNQWFVSK